jgi:hypothetical protein
VAWRSRNSRIGISSCVLGMTDEYPFGRVELSASGCDTDLPYETSGPPRGSQLTVKPGRPRRWIAGVVAPTAWFRSGLAGAPGRNRTRAGVKSYLEIQVVRRRGFRGRQSGASPWRTRQRRRKEEPIRDPVRAGRTGRGAPLLADRVGQTRRGRVSDLFRRGGSPGHPKPRGLSRSPGTSRSRDQLGS